MREDQKPVDCLRGVGQKRQEQLKKLGITTLGELLYHFPRDYIDLSSPCPISGAPMGQVCAVRARVFRKHGETRLRGGMKLYKATVFDDSGALQITFFNNAFAIDALREDTDYLFYGKMEGTLLHRAMLSPVVYPAQTSCSFAACYPLTGGLSNKMLAGLIGQALPYTEKLPERLPEELLRQWELMPVEQAVKEIHRPSSPESLKQARRRLMFEELFVLAAGVGLLGKKTRACRAPAMSPNEMEDFLRALPFCPTGAQNRAIRDMCTDLCRAVPMNRLIQGDVGSGKTIVAAAGAYFAFLSGFQAALMAPTELLARQHSIKLSPLLEQLGMRVDLLLGGMSAAQKRAAQARLKAGETDFIIGTHALLSQGVAFSRLGLVITDEQHRFGVQQRAALQNKGEHPHTLVMSATPIPRTLALMIYGELEVSVIDELPPGRQPIKTYKISSPKRERAFGFIQEHLKMGRQAYIVCPLIESGEEMPGMRAATDYFESLQSGAFSSFRLGLLHGRMKAKEKEETMRAFAAGEIQLLVATTVVEVGVDVPNAGIMLIENAERFGISQLHQLRGRVGRGSEQAFCILLSDSRAAETLERLEKLCKTSDGFALAEYDLQTRGPGNFLGRQQHGLPRLRIADLSTDIQLVEQARQAAQSLLARDPLLSLPEHQPLREEIERMMLAVGDRPN